MTTRSPIIDSTILKLDFYEGNDSCLHLMVHDNEEKRKTRYLLGSIGDAVRLASFPSNAQRIYVPNKRETFSRRYRYFREAGTALFCGASRRADSDEIASNSPIIANEILRNALKRLRTLKVPLTGKSMTITFAF